MATAHGRGWLRSALLVVAAVAVATTITFVVRASGSETICVFFMAAIAMTSLTLGATAGTVAVLLSAIVIEANIAGVWTRQQGSNAADVGQLISFLLVGLLIAQISGALRRSRDRARHLALEAQDARAAAEDARDHAEDASRAKDRFSLRCHTSVAPPAQALLGAAVAIAGVLAAANRTSAVIKVLAEAVPQLSAVLPTVITACGAIIAALSQPPDLPGNRTK